MTEPGTIPVRAVCAMYGINAGTLRNWERRYGFPSPQRTEKGQRSYSAGDVAAIGRMVELVKEGMAPGDAVMVARTHEVKVGRKAGYTAGLKVESALLEAIYGLDLEKIRALCYRSLLKLGYKEFVEGLAFPLLQRLGEEWQNSDDGIAVEHAFSLVVQGLLMERFLSLKFAEAVPIVTMACVPEEFHQLPLLHLCNMVTEAKVARPLLLTGGLPMAHIIKASVQSKAEIIVLSATMAPAAVNTREWLKECEGAGLLDRVMLAGPGFLKTRVFSDFSVRAGAGTFEQTLELIRKMLAESTGKK